MAAVEPAAVLRLREGEGSIRVGGRADLIAVRDTGCNALERLHALTAAEVEFVMIGGRVQLASETVFERLPSAMIRELEPLWVDGAIRWLRAPVNELITKAEEVLGSGALRLGGKPIRLPSVTEVGDAW